MSRKQRSVSWIAVGVVLLSAIVAGGALVAPAGAETLALTPLKDNTLFQWDPDSGDPINSNGVGNFFSAGRTHPDGRTIQRGLIQFDLTAIPVQATISSATLDLYVVDVAKRGREFARPFWLVALEGIGEPSWGEGASQSNFVLGDGKGPGPGRGAPAETGDATWLHMQYDAHSWPEGREGALGDTPVVYPLAEAAGTVPGNLDVTTEPIGVSWTQDLPTHPMILDIQSWVADPASNFGWVLVGEEDLPALPDHSSKRSFASREYRPNGEPENDAYVPRLTVVYAVIPEPTAWTLCLTAMVLWGARWWRRRRWCVPGLIDKGLKP